MTIPTPFTYSINDIYQVSLDELAYIAKKTLEGHMNEKMPEVKPQLRSTELSIPLDSQRAAMIATLVQNAVWGDPDGLPAVQLVEVKRELIKFHEDQVRRLNAEIRQRGKR